MLEKSKGFKEFVGFNPVVIYAIVVVVCAVVGAGLGCMVLAAVAGTIIYGIIMLVKFASYAALPAEIRELFQSAADGNIEAKRKLGEYFYAQGDDCASKKDNQKALSYYEKALKYEHPQAAAKVDELKRLVAEEADRKKYTMDGKLPNLTWKQMYLSKDSDGFYVTMKFWNNENREILGIVIEYQFFLPGRTEPLKVPYDLAGVFYAKVYEDMVRHQGGMVSHYRGRYNINLKPGKSLNVAYHIQKGAIRYDRDDIIFKFRVVGVEYLDGTKWEANQPLAYNGHPEWREQIE